MGSSSPAYSALLLYPTIKMGKAAFTSNAPFAHFPGLPLPRSVEGDAMDRVHGHLVRYGKYTRSRTTLKDRCTKCLWHPPSTHYSLSRLSCSQLAPYLAHSRFTMVHGDKREETDSAIADGQALVRMRLTSILSTAFIFASLVLVVVMPLPLPPPVPG